MNARPRKIGALFPGQGSQYPGMARTLTENFRWTRELYEEASDATGTDLLKLSLEGPESALQLTANAQPAILTTSYGWFEVLRKQLDFRPAAAAGHSLGEYSALAASGAMDLGTAAALVRERGRLMQEAVPPGKGKMAAVLGLEDEVVEALCREASKGPDSLVVPANFNAPSQVVIAGHSDAVDRAQNLASGEKNPAWKARKVIPLKVSAPFHCPLMKPVADRFEASLKAVSWKERAFAVVHNLDAVSRSEGDLVPLLRDQIDHPVLWTRCQSVLGEAGLDVFIEMGPGKVLAGLGKRIQKGAEFFALESLEDFKLLEKKFEEAFA